jgi:hypothetical protein
VTMANGFEVENSPRLRKRMVDVEQMFRRNANRQVTAGIFWPERDFRGIVIVLRGAAV